MKEIKFVLIVGYIIVMVSCGSIKDSSSVAEVQEPSFIETETANWIFSEKKEVLEDQISLILREDSLELYEQFNHHSIRLEMYVDTLNCNITSISIEYDGHFSRFSNLIAHYLKSLSPIDCLKNDLNRTIPEYTVLISNYRDRLELYVEPSKALQRKER